MSGPRPSARRPLLTALLAVLLPVLLGCGREPAGEPLLARHLDDDPSGRLRLAELIAVERLAVAGGDGCLLERGWEIDLPPAEVRCDGSTLILTPRGRRRRAVLTRAVSFDAAEVDAFHVDARGLTRQKAILDWVRAGESFAPARRVEDAVRLIGEGGDNAARLAVAEHPRWRGTITGLRLTVTMAPDRTARLVALSPVRESVDAGRLAESAARPWKIDLESDVRAGMIGPPSHPWRWRTTARPGAELRFAYGRMGTCTGSIGFTVRAAGEGGALHAAELPCDRGGWQEARARLGERSGPLTLEFETVAPGLAATSALPVWAGVELVGGSGGGEPGGGAAGGGLNLVLVSIDTLRPDHLSLYGYPRRTSPRLDERAARGAVVFERAIAAAPWTLPSHVSILTGLDAVRHGVNQQGGLPPSLVTLAEILRGHGYATRGVTGGGFVHQQYGFDQGFDSYWSFDARMGLAGELDAGIERALATLESHRDRRFFLFFHTYAVHNPFLPRQPYLKRLTGRTTEAWVSVDHRRHVAANGFQTRRALFRAEDGRRVTGGEEVRRLAVDLYDGGIAWADDRLARLYAAIDDLGLAGRTLVVVTSDHGELFGEHGEVNHYSLYDENVLVPLVVLDPELLPGVRRERAQVRSIDLVPTVLERLGLPVPEGLDGRSFAPLLTGRDGRDGLRGGTGDAWSYASASNFGIALRRPDGTAWVARNDAWVAPGPRERRLDAGDAGDGADSAALRRAAERRLRKALAGLRVRLRNPGAVPLGVTVLEAHAIPSRMKLDRLDRGGVLTAREGDGGILTIAPGDDLTLVVEGASLATLHLELDHPRHGRQPVNLQPSRLESPRWGGWIDGAWRICDGEPPEGAVVLWWWQGKRADDGGDGAPADEALERQLRALGYLQ